MGIRELLRIEWGMKEFLQGVWVAAVTPFAESGQIDFAALERLVEGWRGRVDGLVVCGTTGEGPLLTEAEREEVVRFVRRVWQGPMLVGVEGMSTRAQREETEMAVRCGAEGVLAVVPPFVRPSAEGLVRHYGEVVRAAKGRAVVAYSVERRSGVRIGEDVLRQLGEVGVCGLKDADGDMAQTVRYAAVCAELGLALFCGDDGLALAHRAVGARGIVSAVGNVCPDLLRTVWTAEWAEARRAADKLSKWLGAIFWRSNPIGVKQALAELGLCSDTVRLPLVAEKNEDIKKAVEEMEERENNILPYGIGAD